MSLFHLNYDRPGPGVRKDEPEKKAVPRFFSIFARKFTALVELNLLFSSAVAAAAAVACLLRGAVPETVLWLIPALLVSPFLAGLTYVTRNYVREEHAFLLSDFWDAVKNNWKAFLGNGAVCCALYFVLSVSIRFYYAMLPGSGLYFVALCLCIAIAFLLISAEYYVPVMIVTFDLKLGQIYRNALIFSIVGLGRNALLTAILAVLLFGLYLMQVTMMSLAIGLLFVLLLLFSLCMFLVNFAVYPLIDRIMIQPYRKKEETGEEPQDFTDGTR